MSASPAPDDELYAAHEGAVSCRFVQFVVRPGADT